MEALQTHSAGLWVSDQLDAETSLAENTQPSQETDIHSFLSGFKPAIPASEQPQTYALDHLASGTGIHAVI
jgi:hypothetical protein